MLEKSLQYAKSFFGFGQRRAILVSGLVLITALLEGVGVLLLVPVLEVLSESDRTDFGDQLIALFERFDLVGLQSQLIFVLSVFLILLVLRNLLVWLRDVEMSALSLGFVDHWRSQVFAVLAHAPWAQVTALKHADIEHALTSDISRIAQGTTQLLRGFSSVIMLSVQIGIAMWLSPVLTGLVILFGLAALLLLSPMVRLARNLGEKITRSGRAVYTQLNRFLDGLKLAKSHNAEDEYVAVFDDTIVSLRQERIRFIRQQASAGLVFQVLAGLMSCFVIFLGVLVLDVSIPVLIVFLLILARLTGPMVALQKGAQGFANMLPAFESVGRLRSSLQSLPTDGEGMLEAETDIASSAALIECARVSFQHSADSKPVLDAIDLTIGKGDILALSGRSGAGKTTLLDILTGLCPPVSGRVYIDGAPLIPETRAAWQKRIAYVPQDPFLFDATLRENLVWMSAEVSDADIWHALDLVEAASFVRNLDDGLDHRVGERGTAMSGGERQRLCLARALLRAPDLLILDEATNALDEALERRVLQQLVEERGDMSVVLVTHRKSALSFATRLATLSDGRLSIQPTSL